MRIAQTQFMVIAEMVTDDGERASVRLQPFAAYFQISLAYAREKFLILVVLVLVVVPVIATTGGRL